MDGQNWRAVAVALTTALAMAGCGGSDDVADEAAPEPTAEARPLATLDLVDPAAEFRLDQEATFEGANDGQPLAAGNVVRTDDQGFAIIEYVDGAVTRLDRNTTFEIVALDDTAEAPEVRVRLDVGRTWHNVSDSRTNAYVVETAVGTAAVRGTVFLVSCPERTTCTVAVVEGEVVVTPTGADPISLGAGEQVTLVADDGAGPVEPATATAPGTDGFVDRNLALDAGEVDPGPGEAPDDGEAAMLARVETICAVAAANAQVPVGDPVTWPEEPVTYAEWMETGEAGPTLEPFGEPWRRGLASSRTAGAAAGDPAEPWLQTETLRTVLAEVADACAE